MIRYFSSKAALTTIKARNLRVSEASTFNDPFEFSLVWPRQNGVEVPHDWLRKGMDVRVRVLCVCDPDRLKPNGDVLMWSHYADKHTGFRIHFLKDFLARRAELSWDVEYEDVVPPVDPDHIGGFGLGARDTEAFEALSLALRSKGSFWSYEEESRFFFQKRKCHFDRRRKFHYLRLPARAITRVDAGLHTSQRDFGRMRRLLDSPDLAHVAFYKTEKVLGRFAVAYSAIRESKRASKKHPLGPLEGAV